MNIATNFAYETDGGMDLVILLYAGDPPKGSVGQLLKDSCPPNGVNEKLRLRVEVWDVSKDTTGNWRDGQEGNGIPPGPVDELPFITFWSAGCPNNHQKTLLGDEVTVENVLKAFREVYTRDNIKAWKPSELDEIEKLLDPEVVVMQVNVSLGKAAEGGSETLTVCCVTLAGETVLTLNIDLALGTINELRSMISDKLDIPLCNLRLVLPDGRLMADLGESTPASLLSDK